MFEVMTEVPKGVIGIAAKGTVQTQDYETVLIPLVQAKLATNDKLRLLLQFGPEFTGYTAGAMWEDSKFGFSHLRDFQKIAVVTDADWLRHAVEMFAPFVPCPVRVFPVNEAAAAKTWVAS
jgi:SpoIIAA-like